MMIKETFVLFIKMAARFYTTYVPLYFNISVISFYMEISYDNVI